MSVFEISPKEKVLCRELNTEKEYKGFFYFDEKSINAEICSFDDFFYIKDRDIFLHTENNLIISLHDNITNPAGTSSRTEPSMVTHTQNIISNTAVIGHDKWEKNDPIKRVSFLVKHADDIFKHRDIFDRYIKGKITEDRQSKIFSVNVNGLRINVSYCATYNFEFKEPRKVWPRVEIEFEEETTLSDYLEHVECITRFLSLSLGVPLIPSDFKICRLSFKDMISAIETNAYPGDYSVKYVWPEIEFCSSDLWVGGSLLRAYDDNELKAFKSCLQLWITRHKDWRKASIQMMRCLSLNGEISSDRLLAACKWFEEIPLTKSKTIISDEDINNIANLASQKALELGYSDIQSRVSGALKTIKSETHEDRFSRLTKMVKDKFKSEAVGTEIVVHLKKAIEFRGKAAHGHFSPKNEKEYRLFSKSIYAMEALCFLLTAYDLPINNDGIERMHNNPLLKNYRLG